MRYLGPIILIATISCGLYAAPVSITEVQGLSFPTQYSGVAQTIKVNKKDPTAAIFIATGDSKASFVKSIVEDDILMTTDTGNVAKKQIKVKAFKLAGRSAFKKNGTSGNITVGAKAVQRANDIAGDYTGTATFQLIYL